MFNSSEYKTIGLDKLVQNQLNIQALYRREQFTVTSSHLVTKGREIGVELTVLILGMVRTIIINKSGAEKSIVEQNKLVVELLNNQDFYSFLSGIKYFEWTGTSDLTEIDFTDSSYALPR
ncbi:hypothetical protein SCACP_35220 [Sporomusa carbonis]|uniref:hypothetical protein n=1 Tax=Sporomusa carbonis TaxID=3076075 RepID=UPI003A66ECAB